MFVSCKAACRDDGAAAANTAALGLPTSQRHPPTLPAAYHCYLGLVYKTDDTPLCQFYGQEGSQSRTERAPCLFLSMMPHTSDAL